MQPIMNEDLDTLWIQKYEPKTMEDLTINKPVIIRIKKWLETFASRSDNSNSIMIFGPHGCGKNISLKILLKTMNYDVKLLSSSNVKNKKTINDIIQSYERRKKMANLFDEIRRNLALIIDDTETINLTNEKNSLLELCKFNNEVRMVPIIFVANGQKGKLITNIQKICDTYEFLQPTKDDMIRIITKIVINENIKFDENKDKVMDIIIENSQYDIRRLIFLLQDLHLTFNGEKTNKIITLDLLQRYLNSFQRKDVDVSLFDATKILLNNYRSINHCLALYEMNKVTLPLTIHQNYYNAMFAKTRLLAMDKQDPAKLLLGQLDICRKITDSASIGDVIETSIYIDQVWTNQNIHGLHTIVDVSYTINSIIDRLITNENPATRKLIKTGPYNIDHSLDLHKTSLKNINKKQILHLKTFMPSKGLTDILYINKIIYDLIKNDKYKEAYELCKEYGIDIKTVEVIIKIDKTNQKLVIKPKNKKLYADA
jgi:DNA polymerase III delta prime subunit